jgi:queuosine precursor transporter
LHTDYQRIYRLNNQTKTVRVYKYFDLVMALFVTVLIVSNVASSAKIVDWGVSLFGLPLAFDAGTILFPISYIFGDVLTEVYGFKRSRRVIWTGFGCLALTAVVLTLVRIMPGEATWMEMTGQTAYNNILGGISTGGLVVASLAAFLAGAFTNSVILARLKVATKGRWLWLRTISSTLVGEGVDSVIFIAVACLFGVFPWSLFFTLIVANYIFKCLIEALMTPVTYWVVAKLKHAEKEDFYDENTRFSILGK